MFTLNVLNSFQNVQNDTVVLINTSIRWQKFFEWTKISNLLAWGKSVKDLPARALRRIPCGSTQVFRQQIIWVTIPGGLDSYEIEPICIFCTSRPLLIVPETRLAFIQHTSIGAASNCCYLYADLILPKVYSETNIQPPDEKELPQPSEYFTKGRSARKIIF